MRGDFRAKIGPLTTASDASESGGAVGFPTELTSEGAAAFAETDRKIYGVVPKIPVLVLSLFNGIGCRFRCYDLVGVTQTPQVAISLKFPSLLIG